MAGKADLVNSIVDSVASAAPLPDRQEAGAEGIRRIKAELVEDWAYGSLLAAEEAG